MRDLDRINRNMLYREFYFPDAARLNNCLFDRFLALADTDRVRQTHHFAGRFENTYIDNADIPEIARITEIMRQQAAIHLGMPEDTLKTGFWFNAMQAGHRTVLHTHDENNELLSGVYYIRVPANSGELILHDRGKKVRLQPEEGKLIMFAPSVSHEVSVHQGSGLRLSVAMNVGPQGSV
jgi:hypothetical protein